MKAQIIILGCGSSLGVPRIDGFWGKCDPRNKKNIRTRSSLIIIKGKNNILIDTSPDLRQQILKNKIKNISSVLYTHRHGDQTHGINDLRAFSLINKRKIEIFADNPTLKYLKKSFTFCFKPMHGYKPILTSRKLFNSFSLGNGKEKINFSIIKTQHGKIHSIGYIFEKMAYLSDCNYIYNKDIKKLKNLNLLIIDCLRLTKHPSHFNLDEVLHINELIKPKKTVLTNLSSELDYKFLLNNLPRNVKPAYDGLKILL